MRIPVRLESIERGEALRYLGWRGQHVDKQVAMQLETAERMALEQIEPVAVIGEYPLEEVARLRGTTFIAKGNDVRSMLCGCDEAVLMAVTLGAQSERLLLRMQALDPAQAAVLDAVLSAAIEQIAEQVSRQIASRAMKRGLYTTMRFSPGYGDMPMEQTREICGVLDTAKRIGLTVSSSGLMIPRKSVCAIVGLGKNRRNEGKNGCAVCAMRESCLSKERTGTLARFWRNRDVYKGNYDS